MRLAAAAALLAGSLHALAQESTLRAVTVTAHPGAQATAFDTPASVDVIDGAVLREGQLQVNLSEGLARVPGLVVQNRQNYAQDLQISSRGFGARSTFGVRGLRLYADGIPATSPDGQGQVSHFDLASAERVEVLRGPFSALYGNASGGVISIVTAEGGPDTMADVSTVMGPNGTRRATVQGSGAGEGLKWRLSGTHFETRGWREHSAAKRDLLNGKFNVDLWGGTRATLVLNAMDMPDTQDPLGLTRAQWQSNPRQASPAALMFDTRKSARQLQTGLVLEHPLDRANSLRVTTYAGTRDTVQFQAIPMGAQTPPSSPGGVIDLSRRYEGLDGRWEHRGRTGLGPMTLTAGLALERTRDLRRGWENFEDGRLGVQGALRRDEVDKARSLAPYLQGQWTLGPRWSASAGLRWTRVWLSVDDRFIASGNGDDGGEVRYSALTPAAGLVWHASDAVNVYASFGRGFETPTLNEASYRPDGTAGLNTALRPALSRQWELGVKADPGTGWTANAALFTARTRDEIVVLANTAGRTRFQNAPGTERRGLELSARSQWAGAWSALLSATWLDAHYSQGFLTCTGSPCATPNVPVASGNRIPGIPRTSVFGELAWRHEPWRMETALEARWVGRVVVDDAQSDAAPAYGTLALRASWRQVRGRWTLGEFVRIDNIANRRYAGSVIVNEGNQRYFEPAPGRQWLVGVSGSYRF